MPPRDDVALQLIEVQPRLAGYLFSLVLDHEVTKDLLQKANVVVLEKQAAFERGTNFFAWVCRIAYHEVLAYRRDRQRERHLFDDDLLAVLASSSQTVFEQQDRRMEALLDCLSRLSDEQRQIITARYASGGSVAKLSRQLRRTPASISSILTRIRWKLVDCIERKLNSQLTQ